MILDGFDKSNFKKKSQSSKKILGYTVEDKNYGILGKVIEIDTQTPQSLLYIKNNNSNKKAWNCSIHHIFNMRKQIT